MKKFLSLVLALVMTMSLVTISAGAKDFTDSSKITYKEAVDVISALDIVDGYSDGDFRPSNTLSRGAAAKIICNMILGPTTADALNASTAPFSDVPVNSTFAGYITYCAKAEIINGYPDGTFRPSGTLTGYAFMKMLLGALGYDSSIEQFTGSNWSVNVAKLALNIGLNKGLKDDFNGSKIVNREEACLYAFNTLQADMVEYENKGASLSINGVDLNFGATNAKAMTWNNSASRKDNIKDDNYIQFAEQYFNKLVKKTVDGDDFMRPATRWDYKGVKVGTYAETPDLVYEGSVKLNEIYADLNMSTKDDTAHFYVNGVSYDTVTDKEDGKDVTYDATVSVSKSNDTKLSKLSDKVGNGTIVEVYRDDDDNHVDIIAISVYGGKISAVKDATSKKDAYVVVEYGDKAPATINKDDNDEFETEDFEEDDVVAYTYSDKEDKIESMYKMESVEGSLTKRTVTKSLQLGDTTYKYAQEYAFETGLSEAGLTNKSDYVVYLDTNGYALWIEEAEFSVDAYALVEKITGDNDSTWDGNRAKLLFADGSEKTVSLDKDYTATIRKNDVVRYKVNDDNEYKLTKITSDNSAAGGFSIKNKSVSGIAADADSKTIFVVQNNSQDDFDVYTGIKKAPTVTGATAYAYVKDGVAKVIFILGGTSQNTSKDVIFIAGESVSKRITESDTADYYTYNAVVKGEITSIMVKADVTLGSLVAGEKTNVILNTTTTDSDDIYTSGSFSSTDVSVYSTTGVKKVSSDEIKLGGKTLSVASNVQVYLVDDSGDIEAISISEVKTNADNKAMYTMEDGEITNLFIIEVE